MAPKEGEAKSKEIKGSIFHWYGKHGHWCGHSTEECLGVGVNMRFRNNNINNKQGKGRNETYNAENDDKSVKQDSHNNENPPTPRVQVNCAMNSIMSSSYILFE
jgi:hypothetical protein